MLGKIKNEVLVIIVTIFVFTGCNTNEEQVLTSEEVLATETNLSGTWSSGCVLESNGETTHLTLTFNGTTVTMGKTAYSDDNCTETTHYMDMNATGTVALSTTSTTLSTGETIYNIDYSSIVATMTPKVQATVDQWNFYSTCQISTWSLNSPTIMTGCDVESHTFSAATKYDIVGFTSDNTIKFGFVGANLTNYIESDRPTSLDHTEVFTLQ